MKLNINLTILLMIILICLSCQSTSNKTENKPQNPKTQMTKSNSKVEKKLKYNDHCLVYNPSNVNSLEFNKSNMYYPVQTTIDMITFNNYIESAYLFHFYLSFMEVYRDIFNDHQIMVMGNPKYLFLSAIENLSKGQYNGAYEQLTEYVEIEKNYTRNPKKYYKLGCNEEDLDWLYSHKDHYTYDISMQLISIIKLFTEETDYNIDFNKKNPDQLLSRFKEIMINLDKSPNTIDIFENIIFSLNKFLSSIDVRKNSSIISPISSFRDFTWETIDILEDSLLISHLNIFNDPYSYILSTQLELSLYKKINYAQYILNDLDILKMDNNKLLDNELNPYSFCHYFELIRLYDINDYGINHKEIRDKLLSISLDWGYDDLILWIDNIETPIQKQQLFSDIEEMITRHIKGKIDSVDYYFLYNQLFEEDMFFSIQSEKNEDSSLLYPDSLKLAIIKKFSMYNSDYDCEEENLCKNIYPRILGYYYDIYEYHSDIIYHKFKKEIIHIGGKPKNPINEGAISLLYAMDDIIAIYN